MEIECVVCGSQNDLRALRCFVCGAELPPTSTLTDHYDSTLNPSSLQGLHVRLSGWYASPCMPYTGWEWLLPRDGCDC